MAALPFDDLDVLIVDEMGKNISGTGMDTNILGRMFVPAVPEADRPRITAVVVLDITEESHGNACGVGLADFTTEGLVSKIDLYATYMNGLTSGTGGLLRNRLPNVLPTGSSGGRDRDSHVRQAGPGDGARGAHQEHPAGVLRRVQREPARRSWRGARRGTWATAADGVRYSKVAYGPEHWVEFGWPILADDFTGACDAAAPSRRRVFGPDA